MSAAPPHLEPRTQKLLLLVRAALIMVLGGLDDYLGLDRERETRKERKMRDRSGL